MEEEEEDADERIASEFKRDYLDAQQAKRRNPPANNSRAPVRKADEKNKTKGPKLGGSRSARAAMYKAMQENTASSSKPK
jgi:hypothetical protein